MLKEFRNILTATFILTALCVLVSGCEVNATGSSRWQKLPNLTKPNISSNIDQGGEFRKALEILENVKLEDDELIRIVVTFWDMAYFAGGLSADLVDTKIVVMKPTDLYKFKPNKERVLPMLEDAHVVFKVGNGLDDWIDPLYEEAKNANPNLVLVDLSRNANLIGNLWNPDPKFRLAIKEYNPWFWLNPDSIMKIADTFYQVYFTFRPEKDEDMRKGSGILQNNMAIFPSSQYQLQKIVGKIVIQDVPAWPYFAEYFDLTIHATLMEDGITEPDEARLQKLVTEAKENNVVAIIKTYGYGNGIADRFAEMSGLPVIELYPHPGMQETGMKDYFQQIMGNTNILLKNFRQLGLPEQEVEIPSAEPEKQPTAEIEIPEEARKALEEKLKEQAKDEESGTG